MTDNKLYPGSTLGLPAEGRGSLAGWWPRIGALVGDWAASTVVAIAIFGWAGVYQDARGSFTVLGVYLVEATVLTILTGGSFGQLIARIGVIRVDGGPLGIWRPVARTLLKCLVIPHVVLGAERRVMTDLLLGTAVVNRR